LAELHFLKEENFDFFEDTKNGPTIMTLPPPSHHNDVCCGLA